MARQFQVPESLDIGYKFLGGKFTMREMLVRLIGLPPAIVVGAIVYGITGSKLITAIPCVIVLIFGYWLGAKKVFNKTIPLLTALQYQREADRKTTELFNYRDYEDKPRVDDEGGK